MAEFRKMSSDEFKESFLAPLDTIIRETSIKGGPLLDEYAYLFRDANYPEGDIQDYLMKK